MDGNGRDDHHLSAPAPVAGAPAAPEPRPHPGPVAGGHRLPVHPGEVDLRAQLRVLRRRWKAMAVVVVAAVALALGLSLSQDPQYRAEAEVLVSLGGAETLLGDAGRASPNDAARRFNNELRLVQSGAVRSVVAERYDGPLDVEDVRASVSSDGSDVIQVHVTASDPDQAAELVNLYVDTYVDERHRQRVEQLLDSGAQIQAEIDELDRRIEEIRAPLTDVEAQLAANPADTALEVRRNILASQLSGRLQPLENARSFYETQLTNLALTTGIAQSSGAQVLTRAAPPEHAGSPRPLRDGAAGLALGLVLAVATAFVVEALDERIRGVADLEKVTGGRLPTLALVPRGSRRDDSFVATRDDARSPVAEAFRSLRTGVKFAAVERSIATIQITSAGSSEGKTTTVANLAVALAQGGDRVAVVCCDLRRPRVQERFGVDLTPGLTDVLLGEVSLAEAVRRCQEDLYVLPAGSPPPNPSELLAGTKAAGVMRALATEFDVVVIDSPPVLPVTDALVVSRMADATILVVDSRATTGKAVTRALQMLDQVQAPVLGVVLNGVAADSAFGSGYGYYQEHGDGTRRRRASPAGRPKGGDRREASVPQHG